MREKVEKSRNAVFSCVFPMFWDSGGLKGRLAKAAGAEPFGQIRDEKLYAVVARSSFVCQKPKTPHVRSTFGSLAVQKVHGVVVRSACGTQSAKSTSVLERFWKLIC